MVKGGKIIIGEETHAGRRQDIISDSFRTHGFRLQLRLFHFLEGRYDVRRRRHMAFRDEWCAASRKAGMCDDYFARIDKALESGFPWDMYLGTLGRMARLVDSSIVLLIAALSGEREYLKEFRDARYDEAEIVTRGDVDRYLMAMYEYSCARYDLMDAEERERFSPYRCYSHRNEHDLRKCRLYNNRGRRFSDMRVSLLYDGACYFKESFVSLLYDGACYFKESFVDFYLKILFFKSTGRLPVDCQALKSAK